VPSPVAARRLEIFAAARSDPAGFARLDPAHLRFSFGASAADVAVPVVVAPDARAIVHGAATEIALLLSTHHRFVTADDRDRIILREEYASLPAVAPRLGPAEGGGPDLRGAAQLGPAIHPALAGGVVSAWMGRGGRGRSLVGLWIELLRRAFEEMAATHGKEETPLLVALALSAETADADRGLRDVLPAPPLDRYLRVAVRSALWIAARTGLARAWRDAGRDVDDPLLARIEAALAPGPLLGGRAAVLAGGSTLYGCELAAGVPRADELVTRLAGGADADLALGELAAAFAADDEASRRAEQAVAVAKLREALAGAVSAAEAAGHEARVAALRDRYGAPGALAGAAADDAARKELARELGQLTPAGGAGAPLDAAVRALKAWRAKEPAAAFGLTRAVARSEYAVAATALLCDLAVDRLLAGARRTLSFRTGAEAEGGADAEWEGGRLYRLSAQPGPILRAAEDHRVGHLFVDVKDFTRRTALVGQASMAEVLRREFYLPIVVAAKAHFGGMGHLGDRGGVLLNNLLGDAVTFSGRIGAMVAIARAVRRHLAAYGERLAAEARARGVEAGGGEGLEAGCFISHGPAPLVVVIDDEVFGRNRVAIADKINESARGTARAPVARVRADAALARERAARRRPGLKHAFSVFLGQPLRLAVPPEAEDLAVGAARAGDLQGGMRALAAAVRQGLEAAAAERGERPGDIYNSGVALSEDALLAFVAEVEGERTVRRVEVEPETIPEALRARWFYGDGTLSLVACFSSDGRVRELFRRVGVAAFKGLGGVAVWELCAEEGGPAALADALGSSWAH
jgi:hypothetical protein